MKIDYAEREYWFDYDNQYIGKETDIFYIYPTMDPTPLKNKEEVPTYTDIRKESVRLQASKNQIYNKNVYAAGDFNFYAPYYRQMTTKVFEMGSRERRRRSGLSMGDVCAAFQHYMAHFNNGRRFILLGHSQGSQMLLNLLKRGMTDEQRQQMIAAYLIGYEITKRDLEKYPDRLKPAQGELDTGVVISYNSVTDVSACSPLFKKTVVCINPLNWKTDESLAPKALHKGVIRFSKTEGRYVKTEQYTSAQIQNHLLVCRDVDPAVCFKENIKEPFPWGNLHFADSWLFAENLRENMRRRGVVE